MAKSQKDPLLGTRIREYEILEVIGKGGMGAVYRARHVLLDEERAIKVIQSRLAGDKDFIDRFIREAKILTKLRHPNLVQLYEFGTLEEDVFFMVLEFLRGESVLERIRRKAKIPIPETIKIIREAAVGLHNAHQKGIIHRDISPDNLLIVKDDTGTEVTKVIDFGIAKPNFEAMTHQLTGTNFFIGKPEYCSPEQSGLLEEGEIIDRRSDIYSLGVTMYYMLCGKLPFYSTNPQGYMLKHATEQPKPCSSHFPVGDFPADLDRLVMKTLTKKRDDRYSTMEEFVREMNKVAAANTSAPTSEGMIEIDVSELQPGSLFARRYLIEKKLGEGGFGTVYKATDKILDVPVALKIMSAKIVHNEKTLERFKREVILARKVAHPNACRIYDIGESHGTHYVSMEFLEGNTLADLIGGQGALSPDVGIGIIRQVLQALQEAHRVGIIHRDLKPQNIMVDSNLKASIMDFGISISADVTRVTQTGVLIGTPYYMAPEQFEGKDIDSRADIYSIGVIMFEILTGRLPFKADSPMAIIYAHLKSSPPKPSSIIPNFPAELETVILKSLEKEPQNRYQSVRDLLRDLAPLETPATSAGIIPKEAIAQKFMAERSYSKAIKYLRSLLKTNPQNQEWKKLLNIALSEKTRKEIRRARSLIRKKNLIQAQLLIEKIGRLHSENSRVISQVKKLESILGKERQKAVDAYLKEAESLLEQKDWTAFFRGLEAASNLSGADPRISNLEQKALALQQEELLQSLQKQLEEAEQQLREASQKKDPEQLRICQEKVIASMDQLLKDNPSFEPARLLRDRVLESSRLEAEEKNIRENLAVALKPLTENKPDLSVPLLKKMQVNASPKFLGELVRIQNGIQEAAAVISKSHFNQVEKIVAKLLSSDPLGWLEPHNQLFFQFLDFAKKETLKRQQFNDAFQKGQGLYEQLKWEEAIASWKQALKILPGDSTAKQWIKSAETRLEEERQIQERVSTQLAQCEELLNEKKVEAAQKILEETEEAVSEYHLSGMEKSIQVLRRQLDIAINKEKAHAEKVETAMVEADNLYKNGQLGLALNKVNEILRDEPNLDSVLRLKQKIEKALHDREVAAKRFHEALLKGKEFFERKELSEAIRSYKRALQITPNDPTVEDLLAKAQTQLDTEQRQRSQIQTELQKVKRSIQSKEYTDAQLRLDEISELAKPEYHLEDLKQEILNLNARLKEEQEKERRRAIEDSISEAVNLSKNGRTQEALNKIEDVLKEEPQSERAIQLKQEIQKAIEEEERAEQFRKIFEEGQKLFNESHWDQAIQQWKVALEMSPKDVTAQKRIAEAEHRLKEEEQVRTFVTSKLKESEDLIAKKQYEDAHQLLKTVEKKITSEYRLGDLNQHLVELTQILDRRLLEEKLQLHTIEKELETATDSFHKKNYQEALRQVTTILGKDPGHDRAIQLKGEIESAIKDQQSSKSAETERRDAEFAKFFDEGVKCIQAKLWKDAKDQFEKADAIYPGRQNVQDYLSTAQKKLADASRVQHQLRAASAQVEVLIKKGKWDGAIRICNEVLNSDFSEFQVDSQLEKIRSLFSTAEASRNRIATIEKNLELVRKLCQKEDWENALLNVNELLRQEPALPEALKLHNQIQAAIQQRELSQPPVQETMKMAPEAVIPPLPAELQISISTLEKKKFYSWIGSLRAAAVVVIAVVAGIWFYSFRDSKGPEVASKNVPRPSTKNVESTKPPLDISVKAPLPPSAAPSKAPVVNVLINALPWAKVKITPLSTGVQIPDIPEEERTTPCFLRLPEGSYELELSNDGKSKPLVRRIQVKSGAPNQFFFTMPAYDPKTVTSQILGTE
jgi:serine/threonine protein kinase